MQKQFIEDDVIHLLKHYLPAQATLKDFVHHNSLHSFQEKEFFDAIFSANKIFGFQVTFNFNEYRKLYKQGRIRSEIIDRVISQSKGKEQVELYKMKMLNGQFEQDFIPRVGQLRAKWKEIYKMDLDNRVQPLLFRILASYIDQGISLWPFPFEDTGLVNAIRTLEKNSFSSFFKSKRAKKCLFDESLTIEDLLTILVGKSNYFSNYLFDQQYAHKGWSGLFSAIEDNDDTIFYKKKVALKDLIHLELLMEIDALDSNLGTDWSPLATNLPDKVEDYLEKVNHSEIEEILQLWQEAFEWDYYDEVLSGIQFRAKNKVAPPVQEETFQAMFCVDDRECSLRRYLEMEDPNCVTLGAPGFFGAAIYFQPFGGKFYDKNAPVAADPKHLIKEIEIQQVRKNEIFHSKQTHTLLNGFVSSFTIGLLAGVKMTLDLFRPRMQADISNAFSHMDVHGKLLIENRDLSEIENGWQVGYQISEMVEIVESMLKGMGLVEKFTPIVYVVAHGSSSANNPHHGAHDCGACSGRPGAVNARVFSYMANHLEVRDRLAKRGISIDSNVQFVGAMHDTASDEVVFYDLDILSDSNQLLHLKNVITFESALDKNAKERARRFASINIEKGIKKIRKEIKERSVSYFEPRPELGHGSNSLCHIGERERTKGLFLDRRAFLQSYDYRTDPTGDILKQVLGPLPGVCGGINLEYYFSRMDIEKMGAGTKLPHNVTGLVGVTNSSDGDIRTGLPLQMVENHDPVRLLMMIEQSPEIVLKVIKDTQENYDWFAKGWIHLVTIKPDTGELFQFYKGEFIPYHPISKVLHAESMMKVIEEAPEMITNQILEATKENIPVYTY